MFGRVGSAWLKRQASDLHHSFTSVQLLKNFLGDQAALVCQEDLPSVGILWMRLNSNQPKAGTAMPAMLANAADVPQHHEAINTHGAGIGIGCLSFIEDD